MGKGLGRASGAAGCTVGPGASYPASLFCVGRRMSSDTKSLVLQATLESTPRAILTDSFKNCPHTQIRRMLCPASTAKISRQPQRGPQGNQTSFQIFFLIHCNNLGFSLHIPPRGRCRFLSLWKRRLGSERCSDLPKATQPATGQTK